MIKFEWIKTSKVPVINSLPEGVQTYRSAEWYGVIHRTYDYPEAAAKAKTLGLDQSYNLGIVNGTKIGGLPHSIQKKTKYAVDPTTGLPVLLPDSKKADAPKTFLCQLSSIQAAPDVPYPWTNQKKAIFLESDWAGIYGEDNQCLFGDMGSLYIYRDADGNCIARSASY